MNLNWRTQRQIIIFTIYFLIVFIPVSIFVFSLVSKDESCYDGILNQDERQIDCGGVCSLQCVGTYRDLKVDFARGLKVDEGVYDMFALIQNYNIDVSFPNVPYSMNFYSTEGKLLGAASGTLSVLPQRKAVVYFPNLRMLQTPKTIDFEMGEHAGVRFTDFDSVPQNVSVSNWQSQRGSSDTLQVVGELTNPNNLEVRNLSVYALLYDDTKTVYAVSRTRVDSLGGREKTAVTFTWGNILSPTNVDFIVVYE